MLCQFWGRCQAQKCSPLPWLVAAGHARTGTSPISRFTPRAWGACTELGGSQAGMGVDGGWSREVPHPSPLPRGERIGSRPRGEGAEVVSAWEASATPSPREPQRAMGEGRGEGIHDSSARLTAVGRPGGRPNVLVRSSRVMVLLATGRARSRRFWNRCEAGLGRVLEVAVRALDSVKRPTGCPQRLDDLPRAHAHALAT